ncbi:hypothetical protein HU200_059916 [Digitaria exilis]|uniref:WAT1-related protein n=1 Tax=Digitaria exilis TaxID=1010633 RepID=A0A835E293_9POAL|nr:hypothetical protein HU200_059916 [Digitaria exilis]
MQKSPPTPTSPLALLRQQPWPAAQCISAVATLWVKAAFGQGTMNPMVLVVYRQGIATLVLVPVTVVAKRRGMMPVERKDAAKTVEKEDSQLIDVEDALVAPLLVGAPGSTPTPTSK